MQNKNILIILVSVVLLGVGWTFFRNTQSQSDSLNDNAQVTAVSPQEFDELAKDVNTFVLDVHIPEQTHISGTDAFIPYNEIADHVTELPPDKNTPILVYCRSGSMSKEAAQTLVQLGYTNIYDLTGGTDSYKESHVTVTITPATQDLGTVIYGDVAKTEFTLTNFTAQPLSITRVATSCGCTKASVSKEQLAPYEEIPITVTFDPAVHKDDTDLGDLQRTIYIDTDNPNFSQVTAEITAQVIKKM
ncbi:DUF1573 domain-containing protein [Candidatus Microgenomates bacterium]|nr:MAG: DUF1573 domain-containing protein [Candidatus Microgenomates bacterium]